MILPRPKLGTLQLDHPFLLAPMAGIGDPPYRRLCRRGGAAMVCAEMVSANALHYNDTRSQAMLKTWPDEHPISLQFFGNDPDRLALGARLAEANGADVVDLNAGCPVPKITKSGGGLSLMKDEALFFRCLSAMVKAVRVPVTVKIRLGFRRGENLALTFARLAEDAGASALVVHARAQEDRHSGPPDLDALAAVVQTVKIPVFGNGGVATATDALTMMNHTGVVGVLIGQAAVGNPFLFWEILQTITHPDAPPTLSLPQRFDLLKEHAQMMVDYYGETPGLRRLRKHIPAYVRGLPHSAPFRFQANRLDRLPDFMKLLSEFESSQC